MRQDRQLSSAEQDAFGAELDALRAATLADLGAADARYIRRIRSLIRGCALAGRLLLLAGWFPPTWLLGTL
ncbi:MAG: acyl-CoA desaturase, partial [Pseudomonas sp.]|nr:acyl-CoA desaturase [Pseudomonas sp.]